MKVAVCYFGSLGATNGPITHASQPVMQSQSQILEIFENNKKELLAPLNADVFIHSWQNPLWSQIKSYYDAKSIIIEEQSQLSLDQDLYDLDSWPQNKTRRFWIRKSHNNKMKSEFIGNSARWYSAQQSIKAAINSGQSYDFIISVRLDLIFNTQFQLPKDLGSDEIFVSNWNDAAFAGRRKHSNRLNHTHDKSGFLDLWFAGNTDTMSTFSNLYSSRFDLPVNAHSASFEYAKMNRLKPRFGFYRGFDFELYRRQVLNAEL